jgi:hypothetical protein
MRKFGALGILAAMFLLAAAPVSAFGGGMSITITGASLSARVAATVNYSFVCAPITDFANTNVTSALYAASVTIDEASGRAIAHGTFTDINPVHPATCDGSTVNHGSITAVSSTVPFHGGPAIVSFYVDAVDAACPFCGGDDFAIVQATVHL